MWKQLLQAYLFIAIILIIYGWSVLISYGGIYAITSPELVQITVQSLLWLPELIFYFL